MNTIERRVAGHGEAVQGRRHNGRQEGGELEYAADLDDVNEDLGVLSVSETEFLPITTRAYLYLSGTPFKAGRRRVHRRADFQLDLHRRTARQG